MDNQDQVTIREYIEAILGNCKEHCRDKFVNVYNTMDILFQKQEDALKLAKVEMERRLEGMNEFREQLEKQAKEFTNKREQTIINDQMLERIGKVEQQKSVLDGKLIIVMLIVSSVVSALITVGIKILDK